MRLSTSRVRRVFGSLLAVAVVAGVATSVSSDANTVQATIGVCSGDQLGAGGEYHPVNPTRILDTRLSNDPLFGIKPSGPKPGLAFDLPVLNGPDEIAALDIMPSFVDADGDGLDDKVMAVMLNVKVDQPTTHGYVDVFGAGLPDPETSVVNYGPGDTVSNSVLTRVGNDGKVAIQLISPKANQQSHVVVDVFGYVTSCTGERGARLELVEPGRIFDSRTGNGKPFSADETRKIQIRGADASEPKRADIVPNDPAVTAVVVNLTIDTRAIPNPGRSYVTLSPDRQTGIPDTSSINFEVAEARSSLAIIPLNDDGSIFAFNRFGNVHVIMDVLGYMRGGADANSNRGRIVPIETPQRVLSTRAVDGSENVGALGPRSAEVWNFKSVIDSVSVGGQPVGPQSGMFGNMTVAWVERQYPEVYVETYLAAYPPRSSINERPTLSNISAIERKPIPNMSVITYGAADWVKNTKGESICTEPTCVTFFNLNGHMDYLFDATAVVLDE